MTMQEMCAALRGLIELGAMSRAEAVAMRCEQYQLTTVGAADVLTNL